MQKKKLPIVLAGAAVLCLVVPLAACQEDLGPAHSRQADWDATPPGWDGGGSTNSNNLLTDWLPECGMNGYYPCPPYGLERGDTFPIKYFLAGNMEADEWSNADGVFSLADYFQSDSKLLFVMYGQWG